MATVRLSGPIDSYDTARVVFGFTSVAVGIIGNLVVISVIVILKDYRRTVTHWYMLQLAIADFLFLIFVPFSLLEVVHDNWNFSNPFCKFQKSMIWCNYYVSAMTLVIMSIDRYLAICHPLSPRVAKIRKPRFAMIVTGVVWVVAIICCYPAYVGYTKYGIWPYCTCGIRWPRYEYLNTNVTALCVYAGYKPEHIKYCVAITTPMYGSNFYCPEFLTIEEINPPEEFKKVIKEKLRKAEEYWKQFDATSTVGPVTTPNPNFSPEYCNYSGNKEQIPVTYFNFIVMFLLPVLTMAVFYGLIVYHVRKSNQAATARQSPGPSRRTTLNKTGYNPTRRVTIMCAALVFSFIILWLPYHIVQVSKAFGIYGSEKTALCRKLVQVSVLLVYLNSAVNPYVYNFLSTDFSKRRREALNKVMAMFGCARSAAPSTGTSNQTSRDGTGGLNAATIVTRFHRTKSEENVSINLQQSTMVQKNSDVAVYLTPQKKQIPPDTALAESPSDQE